MAVRFRSALICGAASEQKQTAKFERESAAGTICEFEPARQFAHKLVAAFGGKLVEIKSQHGRTRPFDDFRRAAHRMAKGVVEAIDIDETNAGEHRSIIVGRLHQTV